LNQAIDYIDNGKHITVVNLWSEKLKKLSEIINNARKYVKI